MAGAVVAGDGEDAFALAFCAVVGVAIFAVGEGFGDGVERGVGVGVAFAAEVDPGLLEFEFEDPDAGADF